MGLYSTVVWSVVMFIVSAFAGFTSFRVRNQYQQAMIYMNAASTGLILAAAFTHLLPDAIEDLSQYSYPFGPAAALAGFLIMVLVETSLHSQTISAEHEVSAAKHRNHFCGDHDHVAGADTVHNFMVRIPTSSYSRVKDQLEGTQQTCPTLERQISDNITRRHSLTQGNGSHYDDSKDVGTGNLLSHSHDHSHNVHFNSNIVSNHSHHHNHAGHFHPMKVDTASGFQKQEASSLSRNSGSRSTTAAASTSLWVALMVHSLMEGFGIGMASSPWQQSTIVVAVLIHKGFASLALASALLESGMEYKTFLYFFIAFCLASPCGALAACLIDLEGGNAVVSGVVTGLASGSFMYIGFMEMLPAMLSSCQHMVDAMALFFFSAIAMAALAAVV